MRRNAPERDFAFLGSIYHKMTAASGVCFLGRAGLKVLTTAAMRNKLTKKTLL